MREVVRVFIQTGRGRFVAVDAVFERRAIGRRIVMLMSSDGDEAVDRWIYKHSDALIRRVRFGLCQ